MTYLTDEYKDSLVSQDVPETEEGETETEETGDEPVTEETGAETEEEIESEEEL